MNKLSTIILLTSIISVKGLGQSFYLTSSNDSIEYSVDLGRSSVQFINEIDSLTLSTLPFDYSYIGDKTFSVWASKDTLSFYLGNSAHISEVLYDPSGMLLFTKPEVILKFVQGITATEMDSLESLYGLVLMDQIGSLRRYHSTNPFAVSNSINQTGLVRFCEPNVIYYVQTASHIPNDPYFINQFYLQNTGQEINDGLTGLSGQDIHVTEAWDLTTGDHRVVVGIVDYGTIEFNHPDLPESKIIRTGFNFPTPVSPLSVQAVYAHGQSCAGIIGAEMDNEEGVAGISPRSMLLPFIIGSNAEEGSSSLWLLLSTFQFAYNLPQAQRPNILSCSFLIPTSLGVYEVIQEGSQYNILFCFAAGNNAQHAVGCDGISQFSNLEQADNVLVVGASTAFGNAADYSNFGTWVDIAAPSATETTCPTIGFFSDGCPNEPALAGQYPNIWTTDYMGTLGYNSVFTTSSCAPIEILNHPAEDNNYTGRFYGTSAATPQVAATVALMRAANSCLSYDEVIEILKSTANQTGVDPNGVPYNYQYDPERPGHSLELGYGRLDAFEAVTEALELGAFDFQIEITDHLCGPEDEGSISVHFPSGNASDYELFVEWPAFMNFEELPSLPILGEQVTAIPNQGERPYLLHVVRTSTGCTSTRQFWIYKENPLVLSTTLDDNCFPLSICAEVSGGDEPYLYHWNNQQGGACLEVEEDGNLQLVVADELGCTKAVDLNVDVPEIYLPLQEITIESSCLFIPGSSITFSNQTNLPDATFQWDFGDGDSNNEQTTTHSYASSGTYTVTLTITPLGCEPVVVSETITIDSFDYPNTITLSNPSQVNTLLVNGATYGGDVVFEANSTTYQVNDLILYLSPNSDIIIHEGATVQFNRCHLTSCSIWNGIDVRANSTLSPSQGGVIFDSHTGNGTSVIEYARIGLETFDARSNANTTFIGMLRAGYITCNRTVFRNNLSAVRLRNARMSVFIPTAGFNRCIFTVNDELQHRFIDTQGDYSLFRNHVNVSRANGYHFRGCTFRNEMTSLTAVGDWRNRGVGISTSGSRFNVQEHSGLQVGQTTLGRFEGLDMGIVTTKQSSVLRISRQVFQRNHIGIFLNHASYCRVFNNTFHIGQATGQIQLDGQLTYGIFPGNNFGIQSGNGLSYEGLVVQKGDFHEIAENTFTGYREVQGGVSDDYARIGVRIRATNTEEMVVRKNNFSRLSFANLANGDNAGGTSTSGLRFICNTNSQNTQDFTNTDFLGVQNSATIGAIQYEPEVFGINPPWPTGNTFSVDNSAIATHFRNEGVSIQSYWHANVANQTPTDYSGISDQTTTSALHSCLSLYGSSHSIPSHALIAARIAEGNVARLEAEEYRYLYLLLLDNGDTEGLQTFVENTWGAQVWDTRDELLSISPFVSEEVIYTLLDETTTYPHAMAFEIIAANPELLNDPKLIAYLSEKSDPMPQYMIDLLLLYGGQSTERSGMEKTMGEKRTQHISKVSEALWGMMDYEDDTYTTDDYRDILSEMRVLNSEFFLINELLGDGDVNAAMERLQNIPQIVPLRREELVEYNSFVEWAQWWKNILLSGRDLENLTDSDLQSLVNIAVDFDTFASSLAISLLNEGKSIPIFTPPALGRSSNQYKSSKIATSSIQTETLSLAVYPNPASHLVQIKLGQSEFLESSFSLRIFDLTGKVIYTDENRNPLNT